MYNDIKVSTDKNLNKGETINIYFDIINHENAIMSKPFHTGGLASGYEPEIYGNKIHSGITKDKDRYFFFEHSIIHKPSSISYSDPNSWHSYHIHQITPELFERISRGDAFNIWEVKFNSLYYFGKYILSVRRGRYVENLVFYSKLEGDTLTIPYGTSPSDMTRKGSGFKTIGEFFKWHRGFYPNTNDLILNKSVIRENLLEGILC
jgi:hypothetical protein